MQQGHDVTVFVRSPQRLTVTHDGLRVLTGSVTDDGQALAAAVRAQDVVISTLGVGRSFKSEGLITRSIPKIVAAMESQQIRRLIFTSAYGVGATRNDVPLLPRTLRGFPRISRADVADFLLTQIQSRMYVRKGVLIAY